MALHVREPRHGAAAVAASGRSRLPGRPGRGPHPRGGRAALGRRAGPGRIRDRRLGHAAPGGHGRTGRTGHPRLHRGRAPPAPRPPRRLRGYLRRDRGLPRSRRSPGGGDLHEGDGQPRLVRSGHRHHPGGPAGFLRGTVFRPRRRPDPHAAAQRGVLLAGPAGAAPAAGADRRGPLPAGQPRRQGRPAADQPLPGRAVGRARAPGHRGRTGGRVARVRRRPAGRRHQGPSPARDAERRAAPVPAGGLQLAELPVPPRPRRRAGRRHGPGQDRPGPGADLRRKRRRGRRRGDCRRRGGPTPGPPRSSSSPPPAWWATGRRRRHGSRPG